MLERRHFTALRELVPELSPAQVWRYSLIALITVGMLILGTCSPQRNLAELLRQEGKLLVATYNSGTTYYEAAFGQTGFEYDVVRAFGDWLGVEIEIVIADGPRDALLKLQQGEAHMAAGLTVTPERRKQFRFGPPVHSITPQMVYRLGRKAVKSWDDIQSPIVVGLGSSHHERLAKLSEKNPDIPWETVDNMNSEGLLHEVAENNIAYTIADSHLVNIIARYRPELRVAFDTGDKEQLAWAFRHHPKYDFLHHQAIAFLHQFSNSGELAQIIDRHFSHTTRMGFVGAKIFAKQTESRLPKYRKWFEESGEEFDLDWRLLAAVGYQESHWNPHAVSPTGVRGLMMLTNATARLMKVNRLDPKQSIHGGAKYLRQLYERLPEEIEEPDRTWMTLASYNVGYGHILDVRKIAQDLGEDPNKWRVIRKHLPKLTQPRWFKRTRYGYARGYEPVTYVRNIRSYYDILVWKTSNDGEEMPEELIRPPDTGSEGPASQALDIETPVL